MKGRKADTFSELIEKIIECKKCQLHLTRRNVVPGEGSFQAHIMFIGEGPGENEDIQGRPFVGPAGKFLDEMINSISLKREEVYITNVVKCRPPGNRDPFPEEVSTCWPWLLEQIKQIRPILIVTLGRHAMERFLPNQKISNIHGKAVRRQIEDIGEQVFYPLYHPAAALYQGSLRQTLTNDFKKIPKVIRAILSKAKTNGSNSNLQPKEPIQSSLF